MLSVVSPLGVPVVACVGNRIPVAPPVLVAPPLVVPPPLLLAPPLLVAPPLPTPAEELSVDELPLDEPPDALVVGVKPLMARHCWSWVNRSRWRRRPWPPTPR